jgi:hypothetical protein
MESTTSELIVALRKCVTKRKWVFRKKRPRT